MSLITSLGLEYSPEGSEEITLKMSSGKVLFVPGDQVTE